MPRRLMNESVKLSACACPQPDRAGAIKALNGPMMSTTLMLPGNDFAESDPEEISDHLGRWSIW